MEAAADTTHSSIGGPVLRNGESSEGRSRGNGSGAESAPPDGSARSSPRRALRLDAHTYDRALSCVHCGLCLPACPTYLETSNEADSPRGRIQLMRGLSDGAIEPTESVVNHLDLCLDCRSCETACPSGVVYHELIEQTRARLESWKQDGANSISSGDSGENMNGPSDNSMASPVSSTNPGVRAENPGAARGGKAGEPTFGPRGRLLPWFLFRVMTSPTRLKIALLPARIAQRLGVVALLRKTGWIDRLPGVSGKMLRMLPPGPIWPGELPAHAHGAGMDAMIVSLHNTAARKDAADQSAARRGPLNVAFFTGCVGTAMCDRLNRQTIDLLAACDVNVHTPAGQPCCGAIHHHGGRPEEARQRAKRVIDLFLPKDKPWPDYIVSHVAGCGSMLRQYAELFREDSNNESAEEDGTERSGTETLSRSSADDSRYIERAAELAHRARDICELLVELRLPALTHRVNLNVTYHDACHLAHAQKVAAAPRQLLEKIPGLRLVPLAESDICCGAAGSYNLTQPAMAAQLADRKLRNIAATGCRVVAAGNIGCAMHLRAAAEMRGEKIRIVHPVELLHEAVFGVR